MKSFVTGKPEKIICHSCKNLEVMVISFRDIENQRKRNNDFDPV
jgi:hypothetical protein